MAFSLNLCCNRAATGVGRTRTEQENYGLDWGARLGFHSAMLAAVGGALVAATDPFRQWLVIMVFLAVAAVWFIAQLALWGEHFGELHEGKVSLATKLDLTLILLNVGIVLIFVLNHPGRRATLCELLAKLWPG